MKYWSLTAVLLAFWLGRETGAGDNQPKVSRFDVIEARKIVLSSPADGGKNRRRCVIADDGMEVIHPDGWRCLIGPGGLGVLKGGLGDDEKPTPVMSFDGIRRRIALYDAEGEVLVQLPAKK